MIPLLYILALNVQSCAGRIHREFGVDTVLLAVEE